ncbi:hypothetical protein DASC09_017090 [Saccharomycopsis crataegensis]|uniref:Mitochondrial group I intron splicing factor CCM1 n=1 Tax=Saccharomycopsis crataegensis TaxID=43959 RepID=A0AAV5QIB2_9ASCO|nr:hypothetical protein DASC09_017090 [Saccharomycopsis crataegensis]
MSLANVMRSRRVIQRLLQISSQTTVRTFQPHPSSQLLPLPIASQSSRQYSLFTRSKPSPKIEIFEDEATTTTTTTTTEVKGNGSILEHLNHEQQDIVMLLNQALRNEKSISLEHVKSLLLQFIGSCAALSSNDAGNRMILYVVEYLNKLKYQLPIQDGKAVTRDDPVKLNEIFNDGELYRLLAWISEALNDDKGPLLKSVYEDKVSRLIIPELFICLKDSKRLAIVELMKVYVYFNKFLLYHNFYDQSLQSMKEFMEHPNSSALKPQLLELSMIDLRKLAVRDVKVVFGLFEMFQDGGNESLVRKWIDYCVECYSIETTEKANDLRFMEQLEDAYILQNFTKVIIGYNLQHTNVYLLEILNKNNLAKESKPVLQEISKFLRESVFDKPTNTFSLDESSFNSILSSALAFKDEFLICEPLIKYYTAAKTDEEISKKSWDLILSWEVFKSSGDDFTLDAALTDLIIRISKVEIAPVDNEVKMKEVDGELYLDLSAADNMDGNTTRFIDVDTVNCLISTVILGGQSINYVESMMEFFQNGIPEVTIELNARSYGLLMQMAIEKDDPTDLNKWYQTSINNGIEWSQELNEANDNILYKAVQYTFRNSNNHEELGEAFKFLNKVKNFVETVDTDTTNEILKKFLQFGYVGDALELLNREFISNEDNFTHKYFGKANEEDIFDLENDSLNSRKIDLNNDYSHKIFITLNDYFLSSTDYEICWSIYGNIHRCFINVPYDTFMAAMRKFNQLKRPDVSLLIFQQMKKMNRLFGLPPPNRDHYIYLFNSFGEMCYEKGIIELHAMLKMDVVVDTNISLNNSLLNAYTNLQDFIKTRDLFERFLAIPTTSKNAINSDTINIMLKSYTYGGLEPVNAFWNNLSSIDYIPNASNYRQFIISNCYHRQYEHAIDLIGEMEFNGMQVTEEVVKDMYNWTEDKQDKGKIKQWLLSSEHSDLWDKLENKGLLIHEPTETETPEQNLDVI